MQKSTLLIILVSALVGALVAWTILSFQEDSTEELIKDFYATEVAVHVSPHGLRKHMDQGDDSFILVDLRSAQEYEREHIIGAINIPAYSDPNHSAYEEVERIVTAFEALAENKEIIVYCYSTPCMTGRKIGNVLAENGIYVQHLGIGWNEWRYHWETWNHEHEWSQIKVEDYIMSGPEPGIPELRELPSPCGEGIFAC